MADRKLFDEEGNEVIVPDQAELDTLKAAKVAKEALETEKVQLSKEVDDLKKGVNPNWKVIRAKLDKLEELEKNGQLPPTTVKTDDKPWQNTNQSVHTPQQPDVDKLVNQKLISVKRDEFLSNIQEDKRETVKNYFNSLTTGKELEINDVSTYILAAMRAAGVPEKISPLRSSITSSGGAIPPIAPHGPTKEQIEIAKKSGNDPSEVYSDKVDYSNMLNADKFIKPKDESGNI